MLVQETQSQTPTELWQQDVEGQLSVDVFETDDAMIIQSAIAGVQAEDLEIFVNPDMVTVRGTRQRDARVLHSTVHYEECFWGTFSRTVILPHHVKADLADAELKDGILTVTIPKETGHSTTVPVRSN